MLQMCTWYPKVLAHAPFCVTAGALCTGCYWSFQSLFGNVYLHVTHQFHTDQFLQYIPLYRSLVAESFGLDRNIYCMQGRRLGMCLNLIIWELKKLIPSFPPS